ncbi:hypothetical protein CAEBREN_05015 [Caenorhabditis brenneri]|uniref:Uncharacterized protein n=1 Tax=Caenorhabditis brenneri TaxID=135651 RepID=G0NFP3_CAEBE|nr:hypothetical protein CAEBREN_05015 [Caenorhabditis brenneri]
MTLSKLLTTTRSRDKENEIKYITKGYPLTTSPVIPDILKHEAGHNYANVNGPIEGIRVTYAQDGLDLVKPESVEMIKKWIAWWCCWEYEMFYKQFKDAFSCNIIAVSIPIAPFTVGSSCHSFDGGSNYGYRKLSESIQCTYHIENGIEYLAGICFYPAPHGSPKLLKSNEALMDIAKQSAIFFPAKDRRKAPEYITSKCYGRYCSTAGKHSLIVFNSEDCEDGVPRHKDFDHEKKVYKTWLCKECLEDFYTYDRKDEIVPKKEVKAVTSYTTISGTPPKSLHKSSTSTSVVAPKPVEKVTPAPVVAKPVKRVCSTENLLKEFEKIDMITEDFPDRMNFIA